MKRNKLYTVNKWNRPAFMAENVFGYEDQMNTGMKPLETYLPTGLSDSTYRKLAIGSLGAEQNAFHNYGKSVVNNFGKNGLVYPTNNLSVNSTDANAFFSDGASGKTTGNSGNGINWGGVGMAAASAIGDIPTGDKRGMWDTLDPVYHIAGGRESAVGNAMSDTGVALAKTGNPWLMLAGAGLKVVGGLTNAAFGVKTNQERLKGVESGIAQNSNFYSNAKSFDDIHGPAAVATNTDVYEGGWFSGSKARRKNEELRERMLAAKNWADRSVDNNISNIASDQLSDALGNYAAYGGPLDFGGGALGLMQQNRYFETIDKRSDAIAGKGQTMQTGFTGGAKTFDYGGLKSAFLDEFGNDPIGAAVRYNQGLEALAAQEEAKQIEAAREQEYADLQKMLLQLETQNQGLEALVAAQNTQPEIAENFTEFESSSIPSKATHRGNSGNANWDYIEEQLRKSGKFNDVQIEGIKYNLQRESSIDPTVVGDEGAAFGLGQWHGSRQPKDRSLEGQTKHLIDTLSRFDGKEHWIGRGNYDGFMNARTPEEAHYYIAKGYERPRADIVAKVKRDRDMSLGRLRAFGGELGTNGTDFTNGLLYIDEGGSHESNPLDGVPMGLDPEGIPNLVEEGETVYNDYVFSDRMNVPDFMLKDLGLPKSKKGISFADASKKLSKESEQRPNDPISQAGLDASLARLAEIQETERMKKNAEEYMGLEYACGGKMKKYATGGKKGNKFWGWGNQPNQFTPWWPQPKAEEFVGLTPTELKRLAEMQIEANKTQPKAAVKKVNQSRPVDKKSSNHNYGANVSAAPATSTSASQMTDEEFRKEYPLIARPADETPNNGIDWTNGSIWKGTELPQQSQNDRTKEPTPYKAKTYQTWMRYAPAVGSGVMVLTDLLGLTNRADYTMADKLEAAADRAGYAPDVKYDPIGDYMRYTPLDRQYYINQLQANARATDRALLNSLSPSRAAGLIANGYNTTLSLGNLARQAEEYNRAQYERTKEFNRKTNMFNSQMGLEAAMANARYHQSAQQMGLSGLAQAAALRDSVDARTGAARSANLTNFLTSLGNIGRENFALNQINWDRSRRHGARANGTSYDKVVGAAYGGKMKRK